MAMLRSLLATLCILVLGPSAGSAASLAAPQGRPILDVTGSIATTNAGDRAQFDLAQLEQLGVAKMQTTTAWTEGVSTFEGVLVRDVLAAVGAKGDTVTAVALNDYKIDIPIADFAKYPVILAFRMNGQELRIRDKGPLWIVYPQDDHPELKTKQTQAKWLWQLKELRIK
jgi:hypothetical protein